MSAFYIHIPFCRQACNYCNFHFSTRLNTIEQMHKAILDEIEMRKDYLEGDPVETIYFGGGTPSLLSTKQIEEILEAIRKNYIILESDIEITLEANPDDLNLPKTRQLFEAGINRLSIGIQSFFDDDLKLMNRIHSGRQSIDSILNARKAGFTNLSIDLIYGIPGLSDEKWQQNLDRITEFDIRHFSAYALTVEPKTALAHQIRTGKLPDVNDEQAARQFIYLQEWSSQNNIIPYEISNYGKEGYFSKHNTAYWLGKKYIGTGPSAHSYNGRSRQWNNSVNQLYIKDIQSGTLNFEIENLSLHQQYNEYILTSLRTVWGCSKNHIYDTFGQPYLEYFEKGIREYISGNQAAEKNNIVTLTLAGKLLADKISSDLFIDEL